MRFVEFRSVIVPCFELLRTRTQAKQMQTELHAFLHKGQYGYFDSLVANHTFALDVVGLCEATNSILLWPPARYPR